MQQNYAMLEIAEKIAKELRNHPTIQGVGLFGSLSRFVEDYPISDIDMIWFVPEHYANYALWGSGEMHTYAFHLSEALDMLNIWERVPGLSSTIEEIAGFEKIDVIFLPLSAQSAVFFRDFTEMQKDIEFLKKIAHDFKLFDCVTETFESIRAPWVYYLPENGDLLDWVYGYAVENPIPRAGFDLEGRPYWNPTQVRTARGIKRGSVLNLHGYDSQQRKWETKHIIVVEPDENGFTYATTNGQFFTYRPHTDAGITPYNGNDGNWWNRCNHVRRTGRKTLTEAELITFLEKHGIPGKSSPVTFSKH